MKFLKKTLSVLLVLSLVLGLCACSSKKNDENIGEIITKAQENMQNLKSMSYGMKMEIGMSIAGQEMNMVMDYDADCILDPIKMKMDVKVDMGALGSTNMTTYIAQDGDKFITYVGADDGDGNISWTKQETDTPAALEQYDPKDSTNLYLKNSGNFKKSTDETIEGTECTRYDGVISKSALGEVFKQSNIIEQFSSLGITEQMFENMVNEFDDMPISIWISKDKTMPVKYEMDMTSIMNKLITAAFSGNEELSEMEVSITKTAISMTFKNFDSVNDIVIPEEALAASAD